MLAHMKQQKDRGVRIGRIFLVFFSRGDEQKCIKKIHRRRADSRAVFGVHEFVIEGHGVIIQKKYVMS